MVQDSKWALKVVFLGLPDEGSGSPGPLVAQWGSTAQCLELIERFCFILTFIADGGNRYAPTEESLKNAFDEIPVAVFRRQPEVAEWIGTLQSAAHHGLPAFDFSQIHRLLDATCRRHYSC